MLKLKKMLCTTDFSEASFEALKYAISLARSTRSKLILMGVECMMFGSTAEKVVRDAHCSVLTVRPPATNF